jgi:amidase
MTHHNFHPTTYHNTIGSHAPVLHIASGDQVTTTTVDSGGADATGQQITPRGNPQTGPFYIDGAEPGDVLALRFDRLWPNRRQGLSGTLVASNAVEAGYLAEQAAQATLRTGRLPESTRGRWELDLDAGTATLAEPATALGRFTLPLAPMLGCFGVAPPGCQAISTATSATHGGNMDYRVFGTGVVIYFPVAVPGALLHVGDGHATQGDGEIVGTGIEISMDVTFTTWIHRKQQPIIWPRAEDDTYLMAVGNVRPLDEALQHATTELLRWLQEDYGLDFIAASTLLGQCVRYDIGNVFDPAYTVVCKVEKRLLPKRN